MTAIILTPSQAEALLASVRAAYAARDMAPYWLPYPLPITSGPHAGMLAVDVGPEALSMVMIGDLTLEQLPDYQAIIAGLGNQRGGDLQAHRGHYNSSETAQQSPSPSVVIYNCR